jgi:hypothetical protein
MKAKFRFYEVVDILGGRAEIAQVIGCRGAVLGMSECDDGRWIYSVSILETGESWVLDESELISTGTLMRREDFYDDSRFSVLVDPETGEGHIKGL